MRRVLKSLAERKQEEMIAFVKDILKEEYLILSLGEEIYVKESSGRVDLTCQIEFSDGQTATLKGAGSGPVDAMFHAAKKRYSHCYSLKDLILLDFNIKGNLEDSGRPDSQVEAVLAVENNTHYTLAFRSVSSSVLRSSLEVCLKSIEYFMNCEEAIKIIYKCIQDAKRRNRGDLEQKHIINLQGLLKHVQAVDLLNEIKNNNN
jgi:hypothetical protein